MTTERRRAFTFTTTIPAPPERVFPLLCPVREHDWIEGWRCQLLFTTSGVAELDCVFRTDLDGDSLWTVSRYEPPLWIEFVITTDAALLSRLEIELAPEQNDHTSIRWRRVYTAVGPGGEVRLASVTEEAFESRMRLLNTMLRHYLDRGEMLREPHSLFARLGHGRR